MDKFVLRKENYLEHKKLMPAGTFYKRQKVALVEANLAKIVAVKI